MTEVMQPLDNNLHTTEPADVHDPRLAHIEMPAEQPRPEVREVEDESTIMHEVSLNGPDEMVPANSFIQTSRGGAVKLHMAKSGVSSMKPISVPSFVKQTAERIPNNVAVAVKRENKWVKWTYKEYYADIKIVAKALIHLGLEPNKGVGIIGFNSPEWFMADLGAIFAGGIAMGIYTTNNPEACQYVASDGKCNIIVVENDMQLQKFLKVRHNLPELKAIIQYTGTLKEKYENVYTWDELMRFGRESNNGELETRLKGIAPNKCCTLVYTSGTTGNPKGVMLSHDNLTWTGQTNCETAQLKFGVESMVSYLPLSHIAAQMMDIYTVLACGCSTYFAKPDALKGSLGDTLKEVRPTSFFAVPRVWEKMAEKMQEVAKKTKGLKRTIGAWAKDVGKRGNENLANGNGGYPFGWGIANALVFKKVRAALGLDRANITLSGAAPMMKETIDYFLQFNIIITEVYGMSECSGPQCVGFPWAYKVGSCGKEINGLETRFDKADMDGNGEVCIMGRHVFMGYLEQPEKTREALDEDGWLHSGDIGRKDDQGNLYITGRIKEIIITAGGENVAPVLIEDSVKAALPCVSQCVVVGDKRKFLSLLITLKCDVDEATLMPKDTLAPLALDWVRELGSNATRVSEILDKRDERILKGIQAGIDVANKQAISRAQYIQKWSILPIDFSIPGGELGPTLKIRRPIVHKQYKNTEEAFYK